MIGSTLSYQPTTTGSLRHPFHPYVSTQKGKPNRTGVSAGSNAPNASAFRRSVCTSRFRELPESSVKVDSLFFSSTVSPDLVTAQCGGPVRKFYLHHGFFVFLFVVEGKKSTTGARTRVLLAFCSRCHFATIEFISSILGFALAKANGSHFQYLC